MRDRDDVVAMAQRRSSCWIGGKRRRRPLLQHLMKIYVVAFRG
jgi:hypothetical protein